MSEAVQKLIDELLRITRKDWGIEWNYQMIMQGVAANVVLMFVSIVIVAHGTQIEGQKV